MKTNRVRIGIAMAGLIGLLLGVSLAGVFERTAIAQRSTSSARRVIRPEKSPNTGLPYSPGILAGNTLYILCRHRLNSLWINIDVFPTASRVADQQLNHQGEVCLQPPEIRSRIFVFHFLQFPFFDGLALQFLQLLIQGVFHLFRSLAGFGYTTDLEVTFVLASVVGG